MKRKVKVSFSKGLPKAKKGLEARTSGLEVRMTPGLGYNANQLSWPVMAGEFSQPEVETNSTLKPVAREDANLEAEVGETAYTDLNGDGLPEHYKIGGKRHSEGGTPLYLPDNSFIFSRDRSMKIKDPSIVAQFGMPAKKGGYTPADIAKKYDINKFRKVLGDPNTDDLQRKSAESMISAYNLKLGKLALAQESIKGFPQGIPAIALPYMESVGIQPEQLVQQSSPQMSQQEVDTEEIEDQPVVSEEEMMMPEARYGRNIMPQLLKRQFGGGLDKFIKGGSSKRKVRVTLPMFQDGGVKANTEFPATKYENEEELYADPSYKEIVAAGKAYLKGADGKYKKVTYVPPKPPKEAYDEKLGDYSDDYAYLYTQVADPAVQTAIFANYQKRIESIKDPAVKAELQNKTQEEVISDFLHLQKQNFALKAKGVDLKGKEWANKNQPQKAYQTSIKAAGFEPLDRATIASAQAAYAALMDSKKDKATADIFKGIEPKMIGVGEEKYYEGEGAISPIDGVYGNTTAGQLAQPVTLTVSNEEYKEEKGTEPVKATHLPAGQRPTPPVAPYIQDVIKTGKALKDWWSTKRRMPWQATPQTFVPQPTFYDPSRELASTKEDANTLIQALSAFSGPQALSSRASQIQGQSAKAAADILGRYNNLNVGVANQFEQQKTSILNQAELNRAQLATGLYDKVTMANEQFDAANAAKEQVAVESMVQGITNMVNTANVNALNTNYWINPMRGGLVEYTTGTPLTADQSEDVNLGKEYESVLKMHPTLRQKPELALQIAKSNLGLDTKKKGGALANWMTKLSR
jgi:hypothetical protein